MIEYDRSSGQARFVPQPPRYEDKPPIVQQAIEVVAIKGLKDITDAEIRAKGCGLVCCARELQAMKEWYR